MSSTYPGTLDVFTNPTGANTLDLPDHAAQHSDNNDATEALEAKLGVGSGTPTVDKALIGSGNGTSAWSSTWNNATLGTPAVTGGTITSSVVNSATVGTPAVTGGTITSSVINTPTVGTPAITGGTANNATLGTPTLTLGSDASGDMYYRSSGGTVTRLGIGSPNQVLTVSSGTVPSWAASSGSGGGFIPTFAYPSTSGPTTSSASYTTVPEMLATVTPTNGTIVAHFWMGVRNNGAGNGKFAALARNGTVANELFVDSSAANETSIEAIEYMWTGVGTTAQTISAQWKVGAGTSTASALSRGLTVWYN